MHNCYFRKKLKNLDFMILFAANLTDILSALDWLKSNIDPWFTVKKFCSDTSNTESKV